MTMTETNECPHSIALAPSDCAICLGSEPLIPEPKRHSANATPKGRVFTAKYPGECPSCHLPITVGQPVQQWTDKRYRHAGAHPCTP